MKKNSYFKISTWMVKELSLSGNTLVSFALIYSFCTNGKGVFYSRQYLMDYLGISNTGTKNILKSLVDKNILCVLKDKRFKCNKYFLSKKTLTIASDAGESIDGCLYLDNGVERPYFRSENDAMGQKSVVKSQESVLLGQISGPNNINNKTKKKKGIIQI